MRVTSLLTMLIAIQQTRATGLEVKEDRLVVDVKPTWRDPRCSSCDRRVKSVHERRKPRTWRHLDLAGLPLYLRAGLRRVKCKKCGVVVEKVPWAASGLWFTTDFENEVAYLAQKTDKSAVKELMRVAWQTVGSIVTRVMARTGGQDRLAGLRRIGVDELSYRRHHEYVTVVINHDTGSVVWAAEGKNADTLKSFFEDLGPERCKQLEAITIDMSQAYIKAITEASSEALIIFDRFHVQRLAHNAVDEVRREEVRRVENATSKRALKKSRWSLLKRKWNLARGERAKLKEIAAQNMRLFRAYLLKEDLAAILDGSDVETARAELQEWLAWASRSKLKPFVKLARTIRKHMEGILAYIRSGLSNGRTEGLNGKARVITRRSFGFHSASSLIAMLFLCCGGLTLSPVRKMPLWSH